VPFRWCLGLNKQRLREKTKVDINRAKQATFDNLPKTTETPRAPKPQKSISLQLSHILKEAELELKVNFHLMPSRMHFSNLVLDLFFDNNKVNSYLIAIPPSRLLSDELEFPITMDMTGISPGEHVIKVDLDEKWQSGEVMTHASQYVVLSYLPVRREDRYVKVPLVRKIDGAFRIILPDEQELYQKIAEQNRKEHASKRDPW
jgi:hypothetical protein